MFDKLYLKLRKSQCISLAFCNIKILGYETLEVGRWWQKKQVSNCIFYENPETYDFHVFNKLYL